MSADSALAVLEGLRTGVPAVADETFTQLAGDQNSYSSRLQLFSFNSGAVKEEKIKAGRFAIVNGQELTDLGDEIVIMPLAIRAKAMDLSGDKPVIAYDHTSQQFREIQANAKVKDSNCMVGLEFLVYIPDHDAFTTFYLANATLLREAQNVKNNLGTAIKCKAKLIKKEKLSWHGMTVAAYPADIKLPEKASIIAELGSFQAAVNGNSTVSE